MEPSEKQDDMDVDAPPSIPQSFSLPLFLMIRTEQAQNGVKHSDYSRYRWRIP